MVEAVDEVGVPGTDGGLPDDSFGGGDTRPLDISSENDIEVKRTAEPRRCHVWVESYRDPK